LTLPGSDAGACLPTLGRAFIEAARGRRTLPAALQDFEVGISVGRLPVCTVHADFITGNDPAQRDVFLEAR
jgi:hypothetical protein